MPIPGAICYHDCCAFCSAISFCWDFNEKQNIIPSTFLHVKIALLTLFLEVTIWCLWVSWYVFQFSTTTSKICCQWACNGFQVIGVFQFSNLHNIISATVRMLLFSEASRCTMCMMQPQKKKDSLVRSCLRDTSSTSQAI